MRREATFDCTECDYKSDLKSELERHMLTHMGEMLSWIVKKRLMLT